MTDCRLIDQILNGEQVSSLGIQDAVNRSLLEAVLRPSITDRTLFLRAYEQAHGGKSRAYLERVVPKWATGERPTAYMLGQLRQVGRSLLSLGERIHLCRAIVPALLRQLVFYGDERWPEYRRYFKSSLAAHIERIDQMSTPLDFREAGDLLSDEERRMAQAHCRFVALLHLATWADHYQQESAWKDQAQRALPQIFEVGMLPRYASVQLHEPTPEELGGIRTALKRNMVPHIFPPNHPITHAQKELWDSLLLDFKAFAAYLKATRRSPQDSIFEAVDQSRWFADRTHRLRTVTWAYFERSVDGNAGTITIRAGVYRKWMERLAETFTSPARLGLLSAVPAGLAWGSWTAAGAALGAGVSLAFALNCMRSRHA